MSKPKYITINPYDINQYPEYEFIEVYYEQTHITNYDGNNKPYVIYNKDPKFLMELTPTAKVLFAGKNENSDRNY